MIKRFTATFLLYCGLNKEDYDSVRPMLWARNIRALKITSLFAAVLGLVFIVLNLFLRSGVWIPYLFLLCGSIATLCLLRFVRVDGSKKELWRMFLCYFQVVLVCIYAGILSIQPGNGEIPATSVIVFIALLPVSIDDRPIRMYSFMIVETVGYLIASSVFKKPSAFSLDIMNAVTFCVVGMVVYGVICYRNVREIHQSLRIERIQRNIISSLAAVVEERDENTGEHIQRTQSHVEALLKKMRKLPEYSKLTSKFCSNVILAAPMHDIGKIKIPDAILNKPGKLTPDEYEIMKKHAEYGGEIIRKTMSSIEEKEYCDIAYNIARYHHERYDGKGYPNGLKGENIPLEARIMALSDVYDALISERVYKEAFTREEAIQIIREGSGTLFDPKLAKLFLECV